ncbi:MAG TPA: ATP-dependent DNA ligase [Kofleriaceae bacterium]
MLLAELVDTSAAVAATRARLEKTHRLALCLRRMDGEEREIGARYLAGELGHKLGAGHAIVQDVLAGAAPGAAAWLTLGEVDRRLAAIAALRGEGSTRARRDQLGELFRLATPVEQEFLAGLATGGVRQGALDGIVVDAIAKAAELPADAVRRAYMLAGDLGQVAAAALAGGAAEIGRFGLTVFRPVLPMLAQTADSIDEALAELAGPAALEHKLDGFRLQLHKDGGDVRAYSRGLNDVTAEVPGLIAQIAALPARRLVLDGEAIAYGPDGRPLPFQDTMSGRGAMSLALFDALLVDDQTLLSEPTRTRVAALTALAPKLVVPHMIAGDREEARAFYAAALASGHEGVMAKALDAPYDAGTRGAAWLKIKKVHRLDLVVLAAEWGSGRRKGWLSNLWLGARDAGAGFVMLGKTFKGMTDATLAWQTAALLARETQRDGHVVHVRPELVVEIAFNDVQRSPRYPGGLALRLARLVRYRDDKTVAESDTIDAVRAIAIAGGVVPA